jgi:hypothetical protein
MQDIIIWKDRQPGLHYGETWNSNPQFHWLVPSVMGLMVRKSAGLFLALCYALPVYKVTPDWLMIKVLIKLNEIK